MASAPAFRVAWGQTFGDKRSELMKAHLWPQKRLLNRSSACASVLSGWCGRHCARLGALGSLLEPAEDPVHHVQRTGAAVLGTLTAPVLMLQKKMGYLTSYLQMSGVGLQSPAHSGQRRAVFTLAGLLSAMCLYSTVIASCGSCSSPGTLVMHNARTPRRRPHEHNTQCNDLCGD